MENQELPVLPGFRTANQIRRLTVTRLNLVVHWEFKSCLYATSAKQHVWKSGIGSCPVLCRGKLEIERDRLVQETKFRVRKLQNS